MVCFGILMVSPSLTVDFGGISASRLQPRRARRGKPLAAHTGLHTQKAGSWPADRVMVLC